jgi:7,8-dihydro-6-hydroxymethylpterin dimethyltransferase
MIAKDSSLPRGLPKKTDSLCPECKKIISATILEKDGKVVMEKTCPEHGNFYDIIWSDVEMYLKAESMAYDGVGVENPFIPHAKVCPNECGLCDLHLSHTALANLDLTNRCNMKCPICFANANQAGYVYEPSFDQVVKMMQVLRDSKPVPCPAIQFAGGEPTIYPQFVDVVKKAKEMGFSQIQVATNGLKFAEDFEFLKASAEAGLNTIYLQFDGMKDDIYMVTRARKMLEVKMKVVENVRKLEKRPSIVLVPVIVKGLNEDQIGPMFHYALENADVIRGMNFQPVAFTGRINKDELAKQRFTLPDLARNLEEQTNGQIMRSDWFPVPSVVPLSTLAAALMDQPKVTFTTHPHCGLATYLFVQDKDHVVPLTHFVDVEPLFKDLYELSIKAEKSKIKFPSKVKVYTLLKKHMHEERMPEGLDSKTFLKLLGSMMGDKSKETLANFSWKMMFIGGMHFQDLYNYDIERVKRCAIHYVVPDGRIIPFCAYNGGPTYREQVEKKFSVPIEEWRRTRGTEHT